MAIVLDGTANTVTPLNGALGATTPSTVVATTVTATTGIVGTTTNNNASAGYVGEYIESVIVQASAVSIPTANISANITSISLTAGDWDVRGFTQLVTANSTVTTTVIGGASTVSATLQSPYYSSVIVGVEAGGVRIQYVGGVGFAIPTRRISLASTTTIYLVMEAAFTVSTASGFGFISARRVR